MMINWKKSIVCISLLVIFFLASCDLDIVPDDSKTFASELRGTWVSNDPTVYSGILEIKIDQITIKGFLEYQEINSNERPFKDFTKNTPLKGYSEDGKIFIEDSGILQEGIPYTFYITSGKGFLRFTFGGRQEIMQRQ